MVTATIDSVSVQDSVLVSYSLTSTDLSTYYLDEVANFDLTATLETIINSLRVRANAVNASIQEAKQQQVQLPDYDSLVGQTVSSEA